MNNIKSISNELNYRKGFIWDISTFNLQNYLLCIMVLFLSRELGFSNINVWEYVKVANISFMVIFAINIFMIVYTTRRDNLLKLVRDASLFVVAMDIIYVFVFQLLVFLLNWSIGRYMIGVTMLTVILYSLVYWAIKK